MYKVLWDDAAIADLKYIDKATARKLIKKTTEHLSKEPERLGKPLTGNLKGLFHYRLGDYRIIYEVHKKEIVIIIVKIGHRRDVYN
jgi:mRNA interferase RelE/StbE